MYTRTIFDTAEEYFEACQNDRQKGDDSPVIPRSVYVVFDNGDAGISLSGEGSEKFELSHKVTQATMITAAFDLLNTNVHIT